MSDKACWFCKGRGSDGHSMCRLCSGTGRLPHRPLVKDPATVASIRKALGVDENNLPLNLTPQEREAAQEPSMSVDTSPTGAAVISGQALFLKVAAAVVAVAGIVLVSDFFPATNIDEKIAGAIVALGSVLGIASPGVRRKE